ncbi:MAG: glycoside hydrolase family protein [Pirellulaceae bacterium]
MIYRMLAAVLLLAVLEVLGTAAESIEIGSRRELFVDDYLIATRQGDLHLELHHPIRRELVFKTDAPWEGNAAAYQSVFQDGNLYRMYYHGGHYRNGGPPSQLLEEHPWVFCYAESEDGIHWRRPELGLFEFGGSKANNIILTPEALAEFGGDPAHTAAFLDTNPACPPEEKYKIVVVGSKPHGLYIMTSADGIHFVRKGNAPFLTEGAFDSQNLAFWDPVLGAYRAYWRIFTGGVTTGENWSPTGYRAIRTATSCDLVAWNDAADLTYVDSPDEQLYTNQIQPYYRAPHILMGFPMRYTERDWSEPLLDLPGQEERNSRARSHPRYGAAITDGLFMTSRDGRVFRRWAEAFLRPGPRERHSWVYGDNFIFWGMLETKSELEDAPPEISLYATESYWEGPFTSIRRLTLRADGFVSASAPMAGGELVTKPLCFDGGNLTLNFETSGAGSVQVEIQHADGQPIEGYALDDCPAIFGDRLAKIVRWKARGGDVRELAGQPVRLRFVLHDADLYSFQFVPYADDPQHPSAASPTAASEN